MDLFFLFGALLGAHAIYLLVLPSADPDHWRAFTSDPEMIAYLTDDFRASGAMQLGFAIMSMTIAGRWFRLGDRWAWVLFWYFPVLFAWSIFTTWAVGLFLTLTLVAVAALVATIGSSTNRPTSRPPGTLPASALGRLSEAAPMARRRTQNR